MPSPAPSKWLQSFQWCPGPGSVEPASRSGPASSDRIGLRDHDKLSVQPRCLLDLFGRSPLVGAFIDMARELDNLVGHRIATVVVAASDNNLGCDTACSVVAWAEPIDATDGSAHSTSSGGDRNGSELPNTRMNWNGTECCYIFPTMTVENFAPCKLRLVRCTSRGHRFTAHAPVKSRDSGCSATILLLKICVHWTRGGCGLANILSDVEMRGFANIAPGSTGRKWLAAPVSGCFQNASAFGYHPIIARITVVLETNSRSIRT